MLEAVHTQGLRDTALHEQDVAEVHVWWMPGATSTADGAAAAELLDAGERARAGRFHFERDRARFVQRHAFVRRVLATYLGDPPHEVVIQHTANGRPVLDAKSRISFSVSGADGLTVVAVTQDGDVGVDIERCRPVDEALDIARAWFSPQEAALLRSLPRARRPQAFLGLWTRKEALAKALGGGLSIPLDAFDVVERDSDGLGCLYRWKGGRLLALGQLEAPTGYLGAVAVDGPRVHLRTMADGADER